MPVSPWILPVLWREHDWRPALERLAIQLASQPDTPEAQRAAVELGRAYEYIEPDRRRAIDTYELAGGAGGRRAHDLAVELAWWPGRARLLVALRATDPDPGLILDEAEAWWDAGQRELCALALAGVRTTDSVRVDDLANLLGGDQLMDHGATVAAAAATLASAGAASRHPAAGPLYGPGAGAASRHPAAGPLYGPGTEAADTYVTAARFAREANEPAAATRWLEAALVARPGHGVASAHLLVLALASREPKGIHAYMRARLDRLDPRAWLDAVRASAFAMIESEPHRGYGLRLLRRALERAYESRLAQIPGHLAMWTVLAAHAAADNTRRELMPLAISALQVTKHAVDRVWLGALATEISLRDAESPIIAGAYAEVIAEHAPEHPIVRELVAAIAADDAAPAHVQPIPSAAVAAATAQLERSVAIDHAGELTGAYADATEAATAVITTAPTTPLIAEPPPPLAPKPIAEAPKRITVKIPTYVPSAQRETRPVEPAPAPVAPPVPRTATKPIAIPPITKTSIAKKPPPTTSAVTAPPPRPRNPTGPLPPRTSRPPTDPRQILDALRTPDRPPIPPRPPDPPDAIPRPRRIAIPIDICLILDDGTRVTGHSRDISVSGLFVLTDDVWAAIGTELSIELLLPGEEAFVEVEYRARARIARRDDDGVGIELVDAEPALLDALAAL